MRSDRLIDVLIPARDEESALPAVVEEIDRRLVRRIVVVDNGSTDRTADVARLAGCHVVNCPQPGYGRACLAGMAFIRADPPDILVFLDGDHSDYPEHIADLVAPIAAGTCDFVVGSRALGAAQPGSLTWAQRWGNRLATSLLQLFWGYHYTDLGPFRAITWESLMALGMQDQTFGWTIEMQIKSVTHGLRIREVPVSYRRRIGRSKISGTVSGTIKAGWKICWTVFKYRFWVPGTRRRT